MGLKGVSRARRREGEGRWGSPDSKKRRRRLKQLQRAFLEARGRDLLGFRGEKGGGASGYLWGARRRLIPQESVRFGRNQIVVLRSLDGIRLEVEDTMGGDDERAPGVSEREVEDGPLLGC